MVNVEETYNPRLVFVLYRFKKNKKADQEEEFNNYSDEDDEGMLRSLGEQIENNKLDGDGRFKIGKNGMSFLKRHRISFAPGEGSNAAPASMVPGPGDSTLRKNFFQLQENNRTLTDEEPSRVNKQDNKQGKSG